MTDTGRGGALPGPLERLGRNRPSLIALLVMTSVATLAGGLSEASTVRIEGEIEANWRGAYDILVRPVGSRLDLESSAGVVEPNFLAFAGQGGISLAQLDEIRSLPDIELAAPVAFVGYVRTIITSPAIAIPEPPGRPTLYRIVVEATSPDGIADHLISRQTALALLGPLGTPDDIGQWATNYGDAGAGMLGDGRIIADLQSRHELPAIASPILAVDPEAERALLGKSAGFLDLLGRVRASGAATVGNLDIGLIASAYLSSRSQIEALQYGSDLTRSRPVVPLVLSRRLFAGLRLTLDVTQLGSPLDAYPGGDDEASRLEAALTAAGSGERVIGRRELDVSAALRPFQAVQLGLTWPGQTAAESPAQYFADFPKFEARLAGRPTYSVTSGRPGASGIALRIEPVGVVGPDENPARPISPDAAFGEILEGREAAYRSLTSVDLPVAKGFKPDPTTEDYPFVLAPLGEFDLTTLELPDNPLNYVPLGAYDPPSTSLVASPDGDPLQARQMRPTLNPSGLIFVPPLAITDLPAATLLRGDTPIDAIRVRVAGLSDYSPSSRARVEAVASRIAALGLDVDVVAGSSPQPVEVFVPGYWAEQDPAGDLGWVAQRWTTLGAAERVERSVGQVSAGLLVLALVTAFVVPLAGLAATLDRRVRESAIAISQGWSPRLARRWITAEGAVGSGIIAAAGLLAWVALGRSAVMLVALGAIATLYLLIAVVGAAAAVRLASATPGLASRAGDLWLWAPRFGVFAVRGLARYGLRSLLARPARTLVGIAATAVATSALSLSLLMLLSLARITGPTMLAAAVSDAVRAMQLAMLGVIGIGSLAFSALLTRLEIDEMRPELLALEAMGWTGRERYGLVCRMRAITMVPTFGVATALTVVLAEPVTGSAPSSAVLVVAAVTTAVALLLGAVARSGTRGLAR